MAIAGMEITNAATLDSDSRGFGCALVLVGRVPGAVLGRST